MESQTYEWKRFWLPLEIQPNLDENGFLIDPEPDYGKYHNPEAKIFEDFSDIHCLALLGEPGIGKSTEFEKELKRLKESLTNSEESLLYLDLGTCNTDTYLVSNLFESDQFETFESGSEHLIVFLDSLDECTLLIDNVAKLIISELRKRESILQRLFIRFGCRTADWPSTFQMNLPPLFKDLTYKEVHLAPLRQADVATACNHQDIDSDAFINGLYQADAVPLATKPITLNFLLGSYKEELQIEPVKSILYKKGCLNLCKEHSDARQDLHRVGGTGDLTSNQRFVLASRIAALSIFCQEPVIHKDDTDPDLFNFSKLCGYQENVDGISLNVTEDSIREVVSTALFKSNGPNRYTFAHITYAEYLASYYLSHHGISSDRLNKLLLHPGSADFRIVPQLQNVSSWIACWNSEFLRLLAQKQPKVLLRSDAKQFSDDDKATIADKFLSQIASSDEIPDSELWKYYDAFTFPGIDDLLLPWIEDTTLSKYVRGEAIRMAWHCKATQLLELLCEIALNPDEIPELRSNATRAIVEMGDNEHKQKIRPLAELDHVQDPNNDIKGNALRALWPEIIDDEELFKLISEPNKSNYIGAYLRFVSRELPATLKSGNLIPALTWVSRFADNDNYYLKHLSDHIILLALDNLDDLDILDAFISAVISSLKNHRNLFSERETRVKATLLFDNSDLRRAFIVRLIEKREDIDAVVHHCFTSNLNWLIHKDDFSWFITKATTAPTSEEKKEWAWFANHTYTGDDYSQLEMLFVALEKSKEIQEILYPLIAPTPLDSKLSQALRENYELNIKSVVSAEKISGPSQEERIDEILNEIHKGNSDWWQYMPRWLANESSSDHNFPNIDITNDIGWVKASNETKFKIVLGAVSYLKEAIPSPDDWLGKRQHRTSDTAPFQAFYLLWKYFPEQLKSLERNIWQKWSAYFLGPFIINEIDSPVYDLIAVAYYYAPDEIIGTLIRIIWIEAVNDPQIHILDKVKNCVDHRMGNALFELLPDMELTPHNWGAVISFLLSTGFRPASELALSVIQSDEYRTGQKRELLVIAASDLLKFGPLKSWEYIWALLSSDTALGKEIIRRYTDRFELFDKGSYSKLPPVYLAELYVWLVKQFPYEDDPVYEGAYSPTPDDHVRELRDTVIQYLTDLGTKESLKAIYYIKENLTDLEWLNLSAIRAQSAMLEKSWTPLTPRDFLKYILESDSRIVASAEELQELVVTAIKEYESSLHGGTATIRNLWDKLVDKKGYWQPKDENHFSDNLKNHLDHSFERYNIVCAREAEARRGQETDIFVSAVTQNLGTIKVIIEVKGCWHREVEEAMETQLVGRYLHENQCKQGIYIIGWFLCDKWDDDDYRKGDTEKITIDEARAKYESQASDLSNNEFSIKSIVLDTRLRDST